MTSEEVARELWVQHLAAPFPRELYDHEHGGYDLVRLDADIAGCASCAFTRGSLDPTRVELLRYCGPIARSAALVFPPGESRAYLSRLADLAQFVLAACSA